MINYIWFFILCVGVLFGIVTGRGDLVSKAVMKSADSTVELMVGLTGMICLWCGIMKIAQNSGLTDVIAKVMMPVLKIFFKRASKDEKAMGAIVMNLTANMMGLSNASTPFGIKAMQELDRLNNSDSRASDDMALFLVLNAACVQLVPTTIISIRAALNSSNPAFIILPTIIVTCSAAIAGVCSAKLLEKFF